MIPVSDIKCSHMQRPAVIQECTGVADCNVAHWIVENWTEVDFTPNSLIFSLRQLYFNLRHVNMIVVVLRLE